MKATRLFLKHTRQNKFLMNMSFPLRKFSNMMGQGSMKDDEFLPEFEEKEMKHFQKLDSSIIVIKKPDSMPRYNEEHGELLYKYDLPIENTAVVFRS